MLNSTRASTDHIPSNSNAPASTSAETSLHQSVSKSIQRAIPSLQSPSSCSPTATTMRSLSFLLPSLAAASSICPDSPAYVHAQCQMSIAFDQPCEQVKKEIQSRIESKDWVDPHNAGTYTLEGVDGEDDNTFQVSRLTGDGKFTDKLRLQFKGDDNNNSSSKCTLAACSTSQVTSVLDFSTNYCNLRNLYAADAGVLHHALTYKETYDSCWQRDVEKCVATSEEDL